MLNEDALEDLVRSIKRGPYSDQIKDRRKFGHCWFTSLRLLITILLANLVDLLSGLCLVLWRLMNIDHTNDLFEKMGLRIVSSLG